MAEIIPSINAATFDEVQARIKKVEPYVSWCHLDVTDGVFSAHPTWRDPADLSRLQMKLKCEVHLMVERPEGIIDQWLVEPIRRVIVHLEATKNPEVIVQKCRSAGREIGFAINPETPWETLRPWFGKVDVVLPLGVPPGASGQTPDWDIIFGKIAAIRQACPSCIIEADGGVNVSIASRACAAGADILVAGSAIFDSSDIASVIAVLRRAD
mgnify:CR=1 FL=1